MKIKILIWALFFGMTSLTAQTESDKEAIYKACMNYIEGFYEGDTLKLTNSLRPRLHKFGFWKNENDQYNITNQMSFEQAKSFASEVLEKKNFPAPDAPKEVIILDLDSHIAAAKIKAWWGIDYVLLSKDEDSWKIEQVLWQGPLKQ